MPSNIDQLIALLDGARRDHDAANPVPRERLVEALALAGATDDEHRAHVREVRTGMEAAKVQAVHDAVQRGWKEGHKWSEDEREKAIRLRDEMCDERNDARADAERVRRGARCLRERCRRLESRARGAEERADIARTAALYAWRMLYEADYWPSSRGDVLAGLHSRVAERYGAEFAAAGKGARVMVDVLGMWPKEEA